MKTEKKETILGIVIVFIISIVLLIIVVLFEKKEEPHSHDYIAVPKYTANEIKNEETQYYGEDLTDTYEMVIGEKKYRGELGDVYFCTEYRKNVCDYICEDNTIMRFVCDINGLEFLSIEFSTPVNIFQDSSKEHIKKEMVNYIREDDKQYVFDVTKDDKYINYNYRRYISGIETLEGIDVVMDEEGLVHKISRYALDGNSNEIDLNCMSNSDESLREELEKEYGKNVEYEIIKKQIGSAIPLDVAINYHVRINGNTEMKKYQVRWGTKLEGEKELGKNCS